MEREKELVKLVNVLRQTARTAQQAAWTGGDASAAAYCTEQYNRVLARLKELDPGVGTLYEPLPAGSSLTVVAMACRQLAAFYADEVGGAPGWNPPFGPPPFNPDTFKDFWRRSASEVEEFGEFIRENIDAWLGRSRHGAKDTGARSPGDTGNAGTGDAGNTGGPGDTGTGGPTPSGL